MAGLSIPSNSPVIELGCGHALPSIAAMKLLPMSSIFLLSDFNSEVLDVITWPNVMANCPERSPDSVRCFAGDWDLLLQHCRMAEDIPSEFGLLLSAETLYTEETTRKVFSLICSLLCEEGLAVISSKRYYFGVGGGVGLFLSLLATDDSLEVVHRESIEDGSSNVRDIIVVLKQRCKQASS